MISRCSRKGHRNDSWKTSSFIFAASVCGCVDDLEVICEDVVTTWESLVFLFRSRWEIKWLSKWNSLPEECFFIIILLSLSSSFSHAPLYVPFLSFCRRPLFEALRRSSGLCSKKAEFAVCLPAPRGSYTLAVKPGVCCWAFWLTCTFAACLQLRWWISATKQWKLHDFAFLLNIMKRFHC